MDNPLSLKCSFEDAIKIIAGRKGKIKADGRWSESMDISLAGANYISLSFDHPNFKFIIRDKFNSAAEFSATVMTAMKRPVKIKPAKHTKDQFNVATISFRTSGGQRSVIEFEVT